MTTTSKTSEILANNLVRLMAFHEEKQKPFGKRVKVAESTINRILNRESACSIDTLEAIAQECGLQAWQLLVDGFDPSDPPALHKLSPQEEALYKKFKALIKEATPEPQ